MENSEKNYARTTIEMFKLIHQVTLLSVMAIKGALGEEAQRYAEHNLSKEDLEAITDFYCSPNWEIIE